jgi:hypothetical protein
VEVGGGEQRRRRRRRRRRFLTGAPAILGNTEDSLGSARAG